MVTAKKTINKPKAEETKTNKKSGDKKEKTNQRKRPKRPYSKTHTGHPLTPKEEKFICNYVETGNARQSVINADYKTKAPDQYAQTLFNKSYIMEEIQYRLEQFKSSKIATAQEVMEYFTSVMKGEIRDQFGLEAPLSERTRAAQELAKRTIDIENRAQGKADAEVKITLNWNRGDEE